MGGAIVRKISEAPAPAESFALDDAVACQPLFFPAKAGIWIVHASGRSGAQHWDAVFWARRQRAAWEVASYDFKSADVHRLNTEAPLVLDGQYLSYLRYFMHIVRADLGTFRLVDQPDRVPRHWPFSPEAIARRVLPRRDDRALIRRTRKHWLRQRSMGSIAPAACGIASTCSTVDICLLPSSPSRRAASWRW